MAFARYIKGKKINIYKAAAMNRKKTHLQPSTSRFNKKKNNWKMTICMAINVKA